MSYSLIKQLEYNLKIAERENDYWSVARIKDTLNMFLASHVKRSQKLFMVNQPAESLHGQERPIPEVTYSALCRRLLEADAEIERIKEAIRSIHAKAQSGSTLRTLDESLSDLRKIDQICCEISGIKK